MIEGFAIGVAVGAGCLGHCLPIVLTYLLGRKEGSAKSATKETVLFLTGRLLAYIGFAAILSLVGKSLSQELYHQLVPVAYILLSVLLLLSLKTSTHRACPAVTARWSSSLTLGLLTGINICTPFVIATTVALGFADPLKTIIYFFGFYLGTSVYFIPLPVFGYLYRYPIFGRMIKVGAVIIALLFLFGGFQMLNPPRYYRYHLPEPVILGLVPNAVTVEPITGHQPYPFYQLYNAEQENIAVAFVSDEIIPGVNGFAGPVPTLIALSPEATIIAVKLLPNNETPEYAAPLQETVWLEQFIGRSIFSPLRPGNDIDAVSGATISTAGLCSGIRQSGRTIAREVLGRNQEEGRFSQAGHGKAVLILIFLAIVLFAYWRGKPWFRIVLLIIAALGLGWHFNTYLTFHHFIVLGRGGFSFSWYTLPFIFIFFAVAGALLFGRIYCGWVCPFGAVQELLSKTNRWRSKKKPMVFRPTATRYLKFIVLAFVLILIWRGQSVRALAIEPFSPFFTGAVTPLLLGFIIFLLGATFLVPRYFCRFLCPLGALLALISQLALIRWQLPAHPGGKGVCGRCQNICPTAALYIDGKNELHRDPAECIECRQCLWTCPRHCQRKRPEAKQ